MMNIKDNNVLFWTFIALVTLPFIIVVIGGINRTIAEHRQDYDRRYWADIGLPSMVPSFDDILDTFGEPLEIHFSDAGNSAKVIYDNIVFFHSVLPDSRIGVVRAIDVFAPEIRLGRHQIGVGSTRTEVLRAFRRFSPYETIHNSISVRDGITWFAFYLDDDNVIIRISISFGGG